MLHTKVSSVDRFAPGLYVKFALYFAYLPVVCYLPVQ